MMTDVVDGMVNRGRVTGDTECEEESTVVLHTLLVFSQFLQIGLLLSKSFYWVKTKQKQEMINKTVIN